MPPPKIFWIVNPLSPLSWVSESCRQDMGRFQVFSSDEALQKANYFLKVNFRVVVRIWSKASPNHFLDLKLESLFYY